MHSHQTDKIEHRVVDVSPDLATAWLANFNQLNRPIRDNWVHTLATRMSEGRWRLNGETIIFGSDGQLLDGQHRLKAVIESACTIPMLKVEGVDPTTWETLGETKPRNGGDVLAREGFANAKALAAAARVFYKLQTGSMRAAGSDQRFHLDNIMVLALVRENPDLVKAVETIMSFKTPVKNVALGQGFLAGIYCEFTRINERDAQDFLQGLLFGTNLGPGSPILLLRDRMQAENRSNGGRRIKATLRDFEKAALIIKAWNFFRAGKSIHHLRWTGGQKAGSRGREEFPIAQ